MTEDEDVRQFLLLAEQAVPRPRRVPDADELLSLLNVKEQQGPDYDATAPKDRGQTSVRTSRNVRTDGDLHSEAADANRARGRRAERRHGGPPDHRAQQSGREIRRDHQPGQAGLVARVTTDAGKTKILRRAARKPTPFRPFHRQLFILVATMAMVVAGSLIVGLRIEQRVDNPAAAQGTTSTQSSPTGSTTTADSPPLLAPAPPAPTLVTNAYSPPTRANFFIPSESFLPNSDEFTDPREAAQYVSDLLDEQWKMAPGSFSSATCIARLTDTDLSGSRGTTSAWSLTDEVPYPRSDAAISLSNRRAEAVAALLRSAGVPNVSASDLDSAKPRDADIYYMFHAAPQGAVVCQLIQ